MVRASWCKWHITKEFPVGNFLSTYDFMPSRAEPLYYVARYYRVQKAYNLAYMFAKVGVDIPYPRDAAMGIVREVYQWKMLDELAASACLSDRHDEAIELCERLLTDGNLPKREVKRVKDNKKSAIEMRKHEQERR